MAIGSEGGRRWFVATHSRTDVPEQTHAAMRAAASRPISGQPASSTLAAGGGLELPGGERHDGEVSTVGINEQTPHEPIPGERDETTLTHREVGAIGGAFNGEDNVTSNVDSLMDDRVRQEVVREGGGADAERHFKKKHG